MRHVEPTLLQVFRILLDRVLDDLPRLPFPWNSGPEGLLRSLPALAAWWWLCVTVLCTAQKIKIDNDGTQWMCSRKNGMLNWILRSTIVFLLNDVGISWFFKFKKKKPINSLVWIASSEPSAVPYIPSNRLFVSWYQLCLLLSLHHYKVQNVVTLKNTQTKSLMILIIWSPRPAAELWTCIGFSQGDVSLAHDCTCLLFCNSLVWKSFRGHCYEKER